MIKLKNTACIEASVTAVWAVLADLEAIENWVEPIERARCEGEIDRGVGSMRVCELTNGITIHEQWTHWDEGRSFEYHAVGMPLVANARNRWTVVPEGMKTLVISEAEIEVKGGWLGKIFEPLLRIPMKAMGPRSMASLKYLVEHGKPFNGRASALPLPPVAC